MMFIRQIMSKMMAFFLSYSNVVPTFTVKSVNGSFELLETPVPE